MEDPYFVKQKNLDARPFTFTDLSTERIEQCLYVTPGNVGTHRPGEQPIQCSLMLSFHSIIVLQCSIILKSPPAG